MLRWLLSLFGIRRDSTGAPATAPPAAAVPVAERSPPVGPAPAEASPSGLPAEAGPFYRALAAGAEPSDLQTLAPDDRLFISGVLKRLREQRLEVPVLPRAALEISRLMGDPKTGAADFARVLESDPALSVDVLRIANSAFYGFEKGTESVRDAVVRIGLAQLRGLVIVTHLSGKVFQGGVFRREAAWLSDLSLALAQLGQSLAPSLGMKADAAFTRGMLMHVEHFVIMGAVAEVSKDHQRRVNPSAEGLLEALTRCGGQVREMAARQWGLQDLLGDPDPEGGASPRFGELRRALVAHAAGEEVPPVDGVPSERLTAALGNLARPRARGPAAEPVAAAPAPA